MEQIKASIARFVLDATGEGITPYYNDIKENFKVPCVYFPEYETRADRESLDSYRLKNSWFINFFHSTTEGAYMLAKRVLRKIVDGRHVIPLFDKSGAKTRLSVRISRCEIKKVDDGVYQLWLEWDESYGYDEEESEKIQVFNTTVTRKTEE